ncbi:thermonuclease family protein [Palleronia sp. KMU-117]|uniref:thermonuclease family protein n=1 Tax=Palleronia sp. KMU-117 TaxID=3434108 RepID=UPI003D73D9CD
MLRMILRALRHSSRPTPPKLVELTPTPTPKAVHLPPRKVDDPSKPDRTPTTTALKGKCYVVDGDTITISGTMIRIAGIDAPELDHPWGKKAKSAMIELCKGRVVTAVIQPGLSYDRTVAKCYLEDGTDLAAEMVRQGLALDWPKYSGGAYRHLEPEGIRKKHWRAAAKQQGRLPASEV